ncbi:HEAT repeat domain-containing protein [Clostridiaceae bacterium 35-E11]
MLKNIMINIIYGLLIVDGGLFFSLLLRKIYWQHMKKKYEEKYHEYITSVDKYIGEDGKRSFSSPGSRLDRKVLKNILFEYLIYSTGDTKEKIIEIAHCTGIVEMELKRVRKKQWWNQAIGAYYLGLMKVEEAIPSLLRLLTSPRNDVRYVSAEALIRITGTGKLDFIIEKVYEKHGNYKKQLLSLIESIEEDIYDDMERLVRKENTDFLVIALTALGQRMDSRVVNWIQKYVKHSDQEVRIAALKAAKYMGDIGEDGYYALLVSLKNDNSWEVRSFLAKVLGSFLRQESREILKEMMQDENWQVRYNAGNSLLQHQEMGLLALSEMLLCEDAFAQDRAWQLISEEWMFHGLQERLRKEDTRISQQISQNIEQFVAEYKAGDGNGLELLGHRIYQTI